MASKRKSTTPCMIPLKTMNLHEDQEADAEEPKSRPRSALDLFLPGDEGGLDTQDGGESSGEGSELHRGEGTFTCQPCYFDSQDLNLFLDHMYSQHPDFRAEPSFSCLDCRLSTKSYESLALHNARVHSNLGARGGFSEGMAWQVGRKVGRTVVEQSLVTTDGLEGGRESEISITKTPIMKMLKGKSESKRILVSHSGDEPDASSRSSEPEKKEIVVTTAATTVVPNGAASKVSHPTMVHIVNSSSTIPVLKTAITQVVSVLQNRSLQQQAPTVPKSSSHLPKVMIPLSSIPTYNAAMDTNCFLKTSFSKFSYPTKAELCYLTVVTKYREEQIKIWFTAQRLKQGISWSPEEIEDARRKMFSTIIQSPPRQSQQQQQTITVLPASLGSNGMHHILQGSLLGQTGVIVTQPVMANGIQVSRSPMALAVTPKPQVATRPQMAVRPTAALVADKGAAMIVSTPSSSSSSINSSGSSSSIKVVGSLPPVVNVTPSTRTLPSSILDPSFYKNKKSQEQLTALKQSFFRNQFPQQEEVERLTRITGLSTREVRKWFSDRRYHYRNLKGTRSFMGSVISGGVGGASLLDSVDSSPSLASHSPSQQHHHNTHHHQKQQQQAPSTPSRRATWHQTPDFTAIRYKERDPQQVRALEASFIANHEPSGDEVDRLRVETKMTRREIDGWFSERRKKAAADKEKQEKEEDEDYGEEEFSGEKARAQRREGDDWQKESSATELKVSPIKINLKMLKVTESVNGKHGPHNTEVSPPAQTESPKVSPGMSSRSKKTPEQLHVLKQLFARTQWPSNVQYDQLSSQTSLLRSEVVRWFGDSRYVFKNGQLRWLEEYQRLTDEQEKGDIGVLEDHQTIPKTLQEKELVETSRLKEEVQGWSSKHTTEEGETKGSVEETADGKGVQKLRDVDERSENSENSGGGCESEISKEDRTSQEPELSYSLNSAAIKLEAD
ncbi:zinc fingers and homeoboxes protein 3 [Polyodon spathula]|uniref:zinc fingers and homeoboxes protein 3 n=1 Tax=Polyodon spathula TaxID=7913 RepID=UPI001B7EE5E6|nr:zinc fingers and homeoboxes protein 3 [Polyodon spathula]XP_041080764.1 zinc fingers and homeoboxes protein 3 [Polyodon spathula]XP_041080765.1 zinc fingers and homeoboxes protein 3 [Polyodon spathula]XP_041080766.1 zinc fingers and homeoboxes protein 3 [Polyodon spathula]